jgi:hypothetical protein
MTTPAHVDALHTLSDRELIAETRRLAERERHATAHVIAALMELDARKLYLGEGCSSLFTYCTHVLHFSEHAAYGRIEAARAARRFPAILDHLADGSLTLTAVGLLAPHVTPENHASLLAVARHKSKRDVEHLIAALRPLPTVPSSVRKLPAARPIEVGTRLGVGIPRSAEAPTTPPSFADPAVEAPTVAATAPGRGYQPEPPKRPALIAPLSPELLQGADYHLARDA